MLFLTLNSLGGLKDSGFIPFFFFSRFDNVRIPRENLLNSVADVSPDGQYLSAIKDPDQVYPVLIINT